MRAKILSLRKSFASLFKSRQYASRPVRCDAHMNELPVPCTPWQPWYNDRQSFYSKHLAAGIIWWVFSLIMALYTGSIYLNWGPPAQPSAPSDMVDEWVFSLIMALYTESIYLNWGPPAQPSAPSDAVEECDDSDI